MAELVLPVPLGKGISFNAMLGIFHLNWAAIDLHTDFAIYKFLKVTSLQAHLITSGMMFGRKARLLVDLIRHSDAKNKSAILGPFNIIRASNREMIAHSYFTSDAMSVVFLERSSANKFSVKEHRYSLPEFQAHVDKISAAAQAFVAAIDAPREEINDFVQTALSFARKSETSPGSP
jgi:hypothetical protein